MLTDNGNGNLVSKLQTYNVCDYGYSPIRFPITSIVLPSCKEKNVCFKEKNTPLSDRKENIDGNRKKKEEMEFNEYIYMYILQSGHLVLAVF